MKLFSSLGDAAGPSAAVELTTSRVSGAVLDRGAGRAAIGAHAVEPLPDGALVASLTSPNLVDAAAVGQALGRVLERLGRPGRIALVIPDPVAKVSLVKFEQVPAR